MEKFCTQCGAQLENNTRFCTQCGAKIVEEQVNETAVQPEETIVVNEEPVKEEPITKEPVKQEPEKKESVKTQTVKAAPVQVEKERVASTLGFFGLMFVYAIPVIGALVALILSFAPKNKNLKHFSRAALIWKIIGFVCLVLIYIAVLALLHTTTMEVYNLAIEALEAYIATIG